MLFDNPVAANFLVVILLYHRLCPTALVDLLVDIGVHLPSAAILAGGAELWAAAISASAVAEAPSATDVLGCRHLVVARACEPVVDSNGVGQEDGLDEPHGEPSVCRCVMNV